MHRNILEVHEAGSLRQALDVQKAAGENLRTPSTSKRARRGSKSTRQLPPSWQRPPSRRPGSAKKLADDVVLARAKLLPKSTGGNLRLPELAHRQVEVKPVVEPTETEMRIHNLPHIPAAAVIERVRLRRAISEAHSKLSPPGRSQLHRGAPPCPRCPKGR
jgi:hypothetical protein